MQQRGHPGSQCSLEDFQVVTLEMEAAMGDQIVVKELVVVAGKRFDAESLRSFFTALANRFEVLTQPCQVHRSGKEVEDIQ